MNRIITFTMTVMMVLGLVAVGVAPAQAAEEGEWARGLSLGFSLTDGNSDTTGINVGLDGERKWDVHELILGAAYSYGETDSETNKDNATAKAQYNRLLNDRAFAYLAAGFLYDDIADVDYQVTVGPGIGYYLIKDDDASLAGEIGATYITEDKGGDTDDRTALRLAERGERKLSETSKVWQSVEFLPKFDDFDVYLLNAEVGAEAAMNSELSLRVVVLDRYDSQPADGRDHNDVEVNAAVVYTL